MIEIIFKCKCMKDEMAVNVRTRRPNEPLASWMRVMQQGIAFAHVNISPLCGAKEMEYCKIPIDTYGKASIGQRPLEV